MKHNLQFLSALTFIGIIFLGCSSFGDKVKKEHIEVYYKKGITKDMAQRTVDFLYTLDTSYNVNTNQTKSIQLLKNADTIVFRMVIPLELVSSLDLHNFYALADILSDSVYNMAPVNIDLTDSAFNSLRMLNYKKIGPE